MWERKKKTTTGWIRNFSLPLSKDKETNGYNAGDGITFHEPLKFTRPRSTVVATSRGGRGLSYACTHGWQNTNSTPLLGNLFTFGPILSSQSYLVLNLLESSFFPSTASDFFALSLSPSFSRNTLSILFHASSPLARTRLFVDTKWIDVPRWTKNGEAKKEEERKEYRRSHKNYFLVSKIGSLASIALKPRI